MPQVVLLLKMPCNSTSRTGTQVANHSWPLALAKPWTGSRRFNALMSWVLGAAPLVPNELMSRAIYVLTDTGETDNQQDQPPDRYHPPHPGGTLISVWHLPAIWNHLHSDDSCGFQWRDVDAVTPEFNLDLQNTSPEYFRHREHLVFCVIEGVMKMLYLQDVRLRPTHGCKEHQGLHRHQWNQQSHVAFVHSGSRHHS